MCGTSSLCCLHMSAPECMCVFRCMCRLWVSAMYVCGQSWGLRELPYLQLSLNSAFPGFAMAYVYCCLSLKDRQMFRQTERQTDGQTDKTNCTVQCRLQYVYCRPFSCANIAQYFRLCHYASCSTRVKAPHNLLLLLYTSASHCMHTCLSLHAGSP